MQQYNIFNCQVEFDEQYRDDPSPIPKLDLDPEQAEWLRQITAAKAERLRRGQWQTQHYR